MCCWSTGLFWEKMANCGSLALRGVQLGDYYAAARISGAPVPPPAVLSRAVAVQGFSCIMTGFWGAAWAWALGLGGRARVSATA